MASYFLAPIGNDSPFFLSTGVAASGAKLFTYTAGSTTKTNTYQDNAGNTLNANPILLNSSGYPASGGSVVEIWLISGTNYKFVLAPSTDTDPPASPYWTRDNISGVNDVVATASEWVAGPTPTYVSATQFTLVGDQTGTFTVGRKLKSTNTAGTIYSWISVSAFTSLTTVTVVNDSGTLDSGLSAISYGLLASTNESLPSYYKFPPTQVASANANTLDDYTEGTFTAILTGVNATVTATASYTKIGRLVTVFYPALTGTSNTTACTITGQPASLQPTTAKGGFPAITEDNGASGLARADVGTNGVVTLFVSVSSNTFTNTGVKGAPSGLNITYDLS